MAESDGIDVSTADWARDRTTLQTLREVVFIREQRVPPELEWDKDDALSIHFLARCKGEAVGTARLLADGHVGRVAVLKHYRGRGVGRAIMHYVIAHARQHHYPELLLSAQLHALDFYRGLCFCAYGEQFMDAGIPHLAMRLPLPTAEHN